MHQVSRASSVSSTVKHQLSCLISTKVSCYEIFCALEFSVYHSYLSGAFEHVTQVHTSATQHFSLSCAHTDRTAYTAYGRQASPHTAGRPDTSWRQFIFREDYICHAPPPSRVITNSIRSLEIKIHSMVVFDTYCFSFYDMSYFYF